MYLQGVPVGRQVDVGLRNPSCVPVRVVGVIQLIIQGYQGVRHRLLIFPELNISTAGDAKPLGCFQ